QPVVDGARLVAWLTEKFAALVKIPAARIQPGDALEKFGIDSMMVLEFTQRLETHFGELSKTLLFEHQTLGELARYFVRHHAMAVANLVGAAPAAVAAPVAVSAPKSMPLAQ